MGKNSFKVRIEKQTLRLFGQSCNSQAKYQKKTSPTLAHCKTWTRARSQISTNPQSVQHNTYCMKKIAKKLTDNIQESVHNM